MAQITLKGKKYCNYYIEISNGLRIKISHVFIKNKNVVHRRLYGTRFCNEEKSQKKNEKNSILYNFLILYIEM